MLTDIHCHLFHFPQPELAKIMATCTQTGIGRIITSAYDLSTLHKTLAILKTHPQVYVTLGIHPQDALASQKKHRSFLKLMEIVLKCCVGLGEIGYDLYPGNPPLKEQRELFLRQLEYLRLPKPLPLIIHCRNAFEQLFEDLDTSLSLLPEGHRPPIILHAYSGGFKYLDEVKKRGYYISFGGAITYKRSQRLRRIAGLLPLGNILLETDAPYVPPETTPPINLSNPSHLWLVAKSLALARGEEEELVRTSLAQNVTAIFDFEYLDREREEWINLLESSLREFPSC